MVPFAGYELPVLYKGGGDNGGVMKEHLWCRADGKASMFDVSHMGQVRVRVRFYRIHNFCLFSPHVEDTSWSWTIFILLKHNIEY